MRGSLEVRGSPNAKLGISWVGVSREVLPDSGVVGVPPNVKLPLGWTRMRCIVSPGCG